MSSSKPDRHLVTGLKPFAAWRASNSVLPTRARISSTSTAPTSPRTTARSLWRRCRCAICPRRQQARLKNRAAMSGKKPGLIARSSIRDGVRFAECWPTSWLNVAGGLSKSLLCFQARRARPAAMLMLAIGVIKRPSFALRAAMPIMPTLTQRSIFYGVRTCALKPVEGHRASGPLKQEPSEEQLEAVLRNLRPSGRRGCQNRSCRYPIFVRCTPRGS